MTCRITCTPKLDWASLNWIGICADDRLGSIVIRSVVTMRLRRFSNARLINEQSRICRFSPNRRNKEKAYAT